MSGTSVKTEKDIKKQTEINDDETHLIVYNDDYNTFDFVIFCFMVVCQLEFEVAVERTFYIHNNGFGVVRSGEFEEINNMKKRLIDCGLTASVQRSKLN